MVLERLDKPSSYYINQNIALYGASGTGKSVIIFDWLYKLKNTVPRIFVFSPTNSVNGAFNGKVPGCMIFDELNLKQIEKIWNIQLGVAATYTEVNKIPGLLNIVKLLNDQSTNAKLAHISNSVNSRIAVINASDSDIEVIENAITTITETAEKVTRKICINKILKHRNQLLAMNLTNTQMNIVKCIGVNPLCTIIFDDCAAELELLMKTVAFKSMMYQGRHNFLTMLLSIQDDKILPSEFKKAMHISYFTTDQCATAYFERKSNSFSKEVIMNSRKYISQVFGSSSIHKHAKLAYTRNDTAATRMKYVIASKHREFRTCNKGLWSIEDKIVDSVGDTASNNPHLQKFMMSI